MGYGLKKELMFFVRRGRLAILIITFVVLSIGYPLMYSAMQGMMSSMQEIMSAMPDQQGAGDIEAMTSVFGGIDASFLVASVVESIAGTASIIMLFIFSGTAGGEQKKRSVIIPQCAGLKPTGYAVPKFILYPLVVFVLSVCCVYLGTGVSLAMFGGELDMGLIAVSALCTGLYMMFITVLQFTVGLCTGAPRLTVVIIILMQMLLPTLLSYFRVDRFNPFALYTIADSAAFASGSAEVAADTDSIFSALSSAYAAKDISTLNIAVSSGTAIVISVILIFVTIFVLSSKQVRNEGNDPIL